MVIFMQNAPKFTPIDKSHLINTTFTNYLRQVNEVNGGDNALVRCVSVCLCACAAAGNGS